MADKYNFLRLVGKGSFGKAWLVQSKVSQRQYVLKEIQVCNMSEKDRHQAVNEVAILARLKHKNIVRYREAFVSIGALNIVMAYADGGDLSHRIHQAKASETSLAEVQIMRWFVQITFALVYIHDLKILHRDLKPQNIFLTSDDVIKLGDFGIARTLKDSQDRARTAIGTPYYLSPEICRRLPYNYKSDIWAAGCVLYELLTFNHPFEADDFSILVLKILRGKFTDIPSTYGPLPGDLVSVLLRVNPDRRPSAEQILSIPSIRRYVNEYTSRSRSGSKISRSSFPSITSTSEDQELPALDNQSVAVKSGGISSKDVSQENYEDVFVSVGASGDSKGQANLSPCSSNVEKECERPEASIVGGETVGKKYTSDAENESNVNERRRRKQTLDNSAISNRKKSCNQNGQNKNNARKRSIVSDGQKDAVRGDKMTRTKSLNLDSNTLSSSNKTCVRDERMLSKEGLQTIKRRKYSCMTPVASREIRDVRTPRSDKIKTGKHLARKHQSDEGTPPVVRLFGNHPQKKGIAINDGWSPDISPRLRTRIIKKASFIRDNCLKKDFGKKQSEQSIDTIPPIEENCVPAKKGPVKSVFEHCNKGNGAVYRYLPDRIGGDGDQTCRETDAEAVTVRTNAQRQDAQTKNDIDVDIQATHHREVCEMLLACSPSSISSNDTDNQARLELLKMFLERKLGNKTAVVAYDLIERLVSEGKAVEEVIKEVECVLPPGNAVYMPLLIHARGLEAWCMQQ